jgi:flagellar basal body P-ring formation protein FlgA
MIRKLLPVLSLIAFFTASALFLFAPLSARADGMKVVTPTRDIARGEVISDGDVVLGTVSSSILSANVLTSLDAVCGMEARRPLRAGEVISATDVRHPVVVTKGQTVTMTFDAPGVSLTALGRAMAEGGVGDTVVVQNPASFRMVNAVVTGAGTVRAAGPAAPADQNQITALK